MLARTTSPGKRPHARLAPAADRRAAPPLPLNRPQACVDCSGLTAPRSSRTMVVSLCLHRASVAGLGARCFRPRGPGAEGTRYGVPPQTAPSPTDPSPPSGSSTGGRPYASAGLPRTPLGVFDDPVLIPIDG